MHALLYRSRSHAGAQFLARDLNDIIEASERNNTRLRLTGLLLYAEMEVVPGAPGSFVQWIEGPEDAVETMFATIQADERHTEVEVLGQGPSDELMAQDPKLMDSQHRLFPIWSMGMVRLSELPATLNGFLDFARTWDGRSLRRAA